MANFYGLFRQMSAKAYFNLGVNMVELMSVPNLPYVPGLLTNISVFCIQGYITYYIHINK